MRCSSACAEASDAGGRAATGPVVRHAERELGVLLLLDDRVLRAGRRAPPAARRGSGGAVEVVARFLGELVQAQRAAAAPGRVEQVDVAVRELQARPDVGVERHAALEVLRVAFDHRGAHRRDVVLARVGRDVHARAGEIAGRQEPSRVEVERRAVVGGAGLHRAQVRDHRFGVALGAAHLDVAEPVRRPAVERDLERRAVRFRVDARAARGEARRGIAPRGELAHRLALRLVPRLLREGHARAQQPFALHLAPQVGGLRVRRRRGR